jgi:hypothetical protein
MARWQDNEDYPKRQSGEAESREEIEERMKTWERFTDKDPEMMRWLVAPLAESIDYNEILRAETPDTATLREWTRSCLITAVEKAFSLQRDVRGLESGKRGGEHQSAFALNREWEDLPHQEPWKSRLLGVLVPINSDFGGGKRTFKFVFHNRVRPVTTSVQLRPSHAATPSSQLAVPFSLPSFSHPRPFSRRYYYAVASATLLSTEC